MKKQYDNTRNSRTVTSSRGYILVLSMIVLSLGTLVAFGLLRSASNSLAEVGVGKQNAKNFYEVERTINTTTAWLQRNSKNIISAFTGTNFTTNFDIGTATNGANTGTGFPYPTLIKAKSTTNAIQLVNDSYFGTSSFPVTANIDTGVAYNAATDFAAQNFGTGSRVRVLLVWALATDGNYEPIFRIDVINGGTSAERGVHGFNFIKSAFVTGAASTAAPAATPSPAVYAGAGYYGGTGDFTTGSPNNDCWSYVYTWNSVTSQWTRGAQQSNCLITSVDDISLRGAIHGDAKTSKTAGMNAATQALVSGAKCMGAGCVTYTLPSPYTWASVCGGNTRDVTAGTTVAAGITTSGSVTTITSGTTAAEYCYRDITVGSNRTINFGTTDTSAAPRQYYIRNIIFGNSSNARMSFNNSTGAASPLGVAPGNKYIVNVESLGSSINGNNMVGTNLAPSQLELNIIKAGSLTLNGTATMNAILTGNTSHTITHSGNFRYYGAYRSGTVSVSGNATLGFDEAISVPPASIPPVGTPAPTTATIADINFALFKTSQRYR